MNQELLNILGKAVIAGGENLTSAGIAGKGKAPLLKQLCQSELLEKQKTKYLLTEKGKAAWDQEASPDQKTELFDGAVAEFLKIVEIKKGKKLNATEVKKIFLEIHNAACDKGYVVPGDKKDVYAISPEGQQFLLSRLPVKEQVSRFHRQLEQTRGAWDAILQRVENDLGKSGINIESISIELTDHVDRAKKGFVEAAEKLSITSDLHAIFEQLQGRLGDEAEQILLAFQRKQENKQEELKRDRETVIAEQSKLERMQKEFELRSASLEMGEQASSNGSAPPPQHRNGPTDANDGIGDESQVKDVTFAAYQSIHRKNLRLGGIVKLPELYDEVRRVQPALRRNRFDDLLLKWQKTDQLVLQVCNDRHLEPRSDEGIESPRGLLFYVQMN